MSGAAKAAAALVVAAAVTAAGIGWLYLLRGAGWLDAGPRIAEALPLQRLAGGAGQPLGRLVAAWLPAGVAGGLVLAAAGFRRRSARAALMTVLCLPLLLALGTAADAVTASDPLSAHLAPQPRRAAIWLAVAMLAAGAALAGPGRRGSAPR